ncbi:class F sortase [Plantactinospora soyae]|uniref:class F sortase n=1 Tax=Plantactinospora soyae TaxID=1544732 RepID=UPI00178AC8B8|nr:class F sortase [Plantactinospora soyae]
MPTRSASGRHGKPWRAAGGVLVALLALSGAALVGTGLNPAPAQPPQPADVEPEVYPEPDWAAEPAPQWESASPTPSTTAAPTGTPPSARASTTPAPVGMPRSEPTKITIPRIKVDAKIMSVGLNGDGTVQVPSLKQARLAGWYKVGASPGEIGNAVIVGHVDSAAIGPAVFFKLGALTRGDEVRVTRKDGKVARFRVDTVKSYPKTSFPSEVVYGTADTAKLQVVTCGGRFDKKEGSYTNNIVVSASRIP